MSKFLRTLSLVFGLMVLGACSIPGTEMPDDGPPVPVSEEAAVSLEQKLAEAAQATGTSTVSVTQEEVTSYLALRISSPEVPLTNPQVYFKEDGAIVLRGNIEYEGQSQPMRATARPTVNNGTLVVDMVDGRIGPIPVPGPILDQLEGEIARAIVAGQDYARLDEVAVGAGTLTLTGERAQQ